MSSTNDPTKCPNCGTELSAHTQLRRQLCQQEYLKTLMKKWAITGLVVALPILFFGINSAMAQYEIQLFAGDNPIILSDQQVNIITEQAGTYMHGMATGGAVVKSDLENFVSQTDFYGTTSFSGLTHSYQSQITIGDKTIIIQPLVVPNPIPFGLSVQDLVLIAGIIVAIAIVAVIVRKRANW